MKNILLIIALALLTFYTDAASRPKRAEVIIQPKVEPMFWWTGMKNPHLQLMVYGKEIGTTRVTVDYPGLEIQNVTQVENQNYLFVNLLLKDVKPGKFNLKFIKDGKTVAAYDYELKVREPGSSLRKGFDPSDAMYLIMPDRFANGNPANDEIAGMKEKPDRANRGGRHGGDIQGIRDNLDYITGMGFTAIWLNPLLENDQQTYSYHGYSTTDFYKVDPRYGTNEEYHNFGIEAKKRGIKLIMDMIFNHCGSEHWWMKDLPTKDWINEYPNYRITSHIKTLNQDPHASVYDKKLLLDGWFVPTMPDLNQRNPLMATYLTQNSIWWVEYAGLSGIRMDTYPYPDKAMMADWNLRVLDEYPYLNIVGEEWHINPAIVSYWQKGKKNLDGYDGNLPSLMDFPLQNAVSSAISESGNGGLYKIYEALSNDFQYPDPLNLVIFPDNHDMSRFYVQVKQDFDLYKMGMGYFLTTRGIPQLFYGDEVLLSHPGDDHGDIRKDFPGGWKGDQVNGFTGQGLTARENEAKDFIRKLLLWRKNKEVIHTGKTRHFVPFDGVYVYFRYNENEKVMVVMNKNDKETLLDTKRLDEMLNNCSSASEVISGKRYADLSKINLPLKSISIFELK